MRLVMQTVYVVQINTSVKLTNPDWETQIDLGIFRERKDAEETMFNVMGRDMASQIIEISEMTSTKRGKGRIAFEGKLQQILLIPRFYRVKEMRVLPVTRW
jgi:hypothetical protein